VAIFGEHLPKSTLRIRKVFVLTTLKRNPVGGQRGGNRQQKFVVPKNV
jgi:hypothetical protein